MALEVGRVAVTSRGHGPPPAAPEDQRRIRPVRAWALVGAAVVAVATYVWVAWLVSGDARTVGTGADRVPAATQAWVVVFEVVSPLVALGAIVYVVTRSVRERQLCLDAMIVIAWSVAWWHDPLINWVRPAVFYNAAFVNLGSWTEQVPGVDQSPRPVAGRRSRLRRGHGRQHDVRRTCAHVPDLLPYRAVRAGTSVGCPGPDVPVSPGG
jgi:hypothetical protein